MLQLIRRSLPLLKVHLLSSFDVDLIPVLCLQDGDVVGNTILTFGYYFFNLMPLTRGSRYSALLKPYD